MTTDDDTAAPLPTLDETAERLRVSRCHLARLLAKRRRPATVRIGQRRLVRLATLVRWLARIEEAS